MKPKFATITLALLIIAPMAHAAEPNLDTQYYGYLRDTCKKEQCRARLEPLVRRQAKRPERRHLLHELHS